jgi:hypothetical protein
VIKNVVEGAWNRWEGLMSQSGSMRFLLVSVGFALFFGSVAVALSAFSEGEWPQVVRALKKGGAGWGRQTLPLQNAI